MKIYIRSSACISPQKTFNSDGFLDDIVAYNTSRLPAIEPDYRAFIDPKQSRRMGHLIRMGIATAKRCLDDANVTMPGAIITGTALGCQDDTIAFLTRMVEQHEELLPPTAFIQSTANTIAAQVALQLHCHNYNQTFVHKGISFESALFDAMMLLKEQEANDILVGATEEMVDTTFKILVRLGVYERGPVSNLTLYETKSKSTICGEGAAFFLLTDKTSPENLAELTALKILYKPTGIEEHIKRFLDSNSVSITDIDLIITGRNGEIKNDAVYDELSSTLFKQTALANYKHLCGDYQVSTSFALWMASNIIKKGIVPDGVIERGAVRLPQRILIYNHCYQKYHSLMLVSAI